MDVPRFGSFGAAQPSGEMYIAPTPTSPLGCKWTKMAEDSGDEAPPMPRATMDNFRFNPNSFKFGFACQNE